MTSKTTSYVIKEDCANALALKKDNSQVVVAGRKVIKLFNLLENEIEENCNLKMGKNSNLNFSCNDVAWNHLEENILATAATNGAVVIWEIGSRKREHYVYRDHTRTVHKVSFHLTEPMLLISGSQDGTMKCFDLRVKEATKTFYSNTESVRDVKFSPHQHHVFAAVSENGQVQLWDIRKPDKFFQVFAAHNGPIFTCDWHPDIAWLATASRDKSIKVWDLTGPSPNCEHTINTIFPVARIKWRPQRKYHITSCALQLDSSIYVWDVRRPYIPFAVFKEHKEAPTGISWRGDPHSLLSIGRVNVSTNFYGTLCHHVFKDANRPATEVNSHAHTLNIKGSAVFACKLPVAKTPERAVDKYVRSTSQSDTFYRVQSVVQEFKAIESKNSEWFEFCAKNYLLSGNLSDICDHNSVIARQVGRNEVSTVWSMIKIMFQYPFRNKINPPNLGKAASLINDLSINEKVFENGHNNKLLQIEKGPTKLSGVDEEVETNGENHTSVESFLSNNKKASLGYMNPHKADFSFGEGELEPTIIDYGDTLISNDDIDCWSLPKEAFPLRHEIVHRPPPLDRYSNHSPDVNEGFVGTPVVVQDVPHKLAVTWTFKPTFWNPLKQVEDMLKFHADKQDIQTVACVLIALGDRRNDLNIDLITQEHWIEEYLDLLQRFRLWEVVATIIKSSWIPSIAQLSQQSTVYRVCCPTCSKPIQGPAWLCDRCKSSDHARCALCRQVVRGFFTWCRICAHGGHPEHMKGWFKTNDQCPTGCGHRCRSFF